MLVDSDWVTAVHQVFRKIDTYSTLFHAIFLLCPPVLITSFVTDATSSSIYQRTLVSCYGVFYLALALSIVAYRLSPSHPLARYPGPFWYRTSSFCHAFLSVSGQRNTYLKALHERYGDVVRTGRVVYIGAFLGQIFPLVGISTVEEHVRRRRAWNRGLGPAALKEYEQLTTQRARQLADALEQQRRVSLEKWFDYFAYDLMSDMAFGGGSELMLEGDKDGVWSILQQGTRAASFFSTVPWLGLCIGKIPVAVRPLHIFITHGKEAVVKRMRCGSTTRDLFHYLNNEDLPDKEPAPMQQLVDDGILAVTAGSDTTASALTSIFFCLLTHPNVYASLCEEVDTFYPKGEDAFVTKHHGTMPYMNAVINEALRLYAPITTGGSRQVPRESDGVYAGSIYLSAGTTVYFPAYSLHRDARNFSFPDAFWPERWLIASGQVALEDARPPPSSTLKPTSSKFAHEEIAFIPFSAGPMNCVGRGFAMQEMRMVLCALAQRFRFRPREGWDIREYETHYKDYFVSTRPPLPAIVQPR
ncbi:cytochrome P450 [Dichomitus squalens LYAD-421 SS1]|uniref:Cytochrome P450 n=1 Tax=Dichomitus squalens (strain LYAD-421) TaxID=732165 RepID=R7SZM9_DICSQ|nr:cytochrome P450 [Dichomitus squalens LYAD-421 SS1]EJF61644.1 cytochrome P450 [Dichomitus squalens LYAD-421 SS1]